jgi:copper-binding protein NosD
MGRIAHSPLSVSTIVLLSITPPLAHASVAVVPDDYPVIQQALDSADTVYVRGGTYLELPTFAAKDSGPRLLSRHPTSAERPRLPGITLASKWSRPLIKLEGIEVEGQVQLYNEEYKGQFEIDACLLHSGAATILSGDQIDLTLTRSMIYGDVNVRAVRVNAELESDTLRAGGFIVGDECQFLVASVTICLFEGPGLTALGLGRGMGRATITRNRVNGYRTGILAISDADFEVADNDIAYCDEGIHLVGDVVAVHTNEIRDCGAGIFVAGETHDGRRQVTDNRVLGSGQIGIRVQDVEAFAYVERNVVGRSGGHGFVIETSRTGDDLPPGIIHQNTSYANGGSGFVLSHLTRNVVGTTPPTMTHNLAYGNRAHALEWSGRGVYPETPLPVLDHTCNDWFANALDAVSGTQPNPLDIEVDPLFCGVDSDSVSLRTGSPLLDAAGCGLIGARGMGCTATATLVSLFAAERSPEGVRVRWRLSEPGHFDEVWVERSAAATGPWTRIATERAPDGDVTVDIDRDVATNHVYWYRLAGVMDGAMEILTGPVEVAPLAPVGFHLRAISPTQGAGRARVVFELPHPASIDLEVLDLQGRFVATLARGPWPLGRHEIEWPTGERASPGVFFVRYRFPGGEAVGKLFVLK